MLTPDLEAALSAGVRQPDYRLYAFDPAQDDYTEIITGTYGQTPLELSPYLSGPLNWTPAQLSFTLQDPDGDFHPDTGSLRNYLRDGAVLRLLEGDARVSQGDWIWTFTGAVKGQLGWKKGPRGAVLTAQLSAYGRENTQAFKRRKITSKEYTAGTDLGIMFYDLANTFLGLSDAENLVPRILGRHFLHKSNQIVQMAPWEALAGILEVICGVPCFNGEGKLTWWSKNLARTPDRILPDYIRIYDFQVPARTQDVINKVIVVFIDANLEEVEGSLQCLGKASITTGFFTFEEKIPCYWSEDRKQRAKQTWMKVIKSVNDNLLPVGEESYAEHDEFHGEITIEISAWVPTLAGALLAEYIALSFEPDWAEVPAFGIWPTITYGKLLQAQALVSILLIMMSLGSAQYEIWGIPYDMVYLKKKSIAVQQGLEIWEEIDKEIKNDFIGSHEQADAVAVTEWIYEQSQGHPRIIVMDDDLALEKGDIFQLPDGRRIFITDLAKSIQRGQIPKLQVQGFKVLAA
jgi:hypothetical protein